MGCQICKKTTVNECTIEKTGKNLRSNQYRNNQFSNDIVTDHISISQKMKSMDDIITVTIDESNDSVKIKVDDRNAFNKSFIQQRQQAIDSHSYRSNIESWQPQSLQHLVDMIRTFSKGKSLVDCHWIIFYWITVNIEYDVVSYFSKNYKNQTAEGVFQTRKGVCAGYANVYKYLCDQLQLPCEIVNGNAKGYGFDDREGAPTETDHAWNAVEIDDHWYLMESTWGAGHVNKEKIFTRELNTYYFLPRPNEMIYHHFPENGKWQLLQTPIKMSQYMQMPKTYPSYFELNLEIISPRNQNYVDLVPNKSYALVLIRAPSDVHLMAALKLNDEKIDGGHQIIYDHQKQLHCCYFAPSNIGKHTITIYGRKSNVEIGIYNEVINFTLNIKKLPSRPISFPNVWRNFSNLGLEIISPKDTHIIKLPNGKNQTEIQIRTPSDVLLHGRLENSNDETIDNGSSIYFDRQRDVWRCKFAPNEIGSFTALIMAKKKSDPGSYTSAVSFKIQVKQISSTPISYPHIWQQFYDFGLKIEAPKDRANAVWAENASYAEVLIQAPDDVILSCTIECNRIEIENGSLAQYDHDKKLWQLLFAPEQTGSHELMIYARQISNNNDNISQLVVKFNLNVTKLRQPMKFPLIYTQFHTDRCRIYTPMNGVLKRGSTVPIHCVIPGAIDVSMQVDSKWIDNKGYRNPILEKEITVGSKDVVIYAKYDEKSKYQGLVRYTVQ